MVSELQIFKISPKKVVPSSQRDLNTTGMFHSTNLGYKSVISLVFFNHPTPIFPPYVEENSSLVPSLSLSPNILGPYRLKEASLALKCLVGRE